MWICRYLGVDAPGFVGSRDRYRLTPPCPAALGKKRATATVRAEGATRVLLLLPASGRGHRPTTPSHSVAAFANRIRCQHSSATCAASPVSCHSGGALRAYGFFGGGG